MIVSTDLAWPDTVALLDELSPQAREPWLLDDVVEVDQLREYSMARDEVKLDVRAASDLGTQTIELIRALLRHGGTGEVGGRRWTLAVFEQAVRTGGAGAAARLAEAALDELIDSVPNAEVLGWGVVANAVQERLHGEDLEVRGGLKHFTGGTKLWVSQPWSGDGGERLWVTGPHRRSRKPIRIIVHRRHLENPRAKAVYSAVLLRRLESLSPRVPMLHGTAASAERWAASLATPMLDADLEGVPPRWLWVPDPPPMELDLDGTKVYLAHFNHRRARYSTLPPPVEP